MATKTSQANSSTHIDPYRRLASTLRSLLQERSATAILDRVATDVRDLIRCDDVVIWELQRTVLAPAVVDGDDAEAMLALRVRLGEGITGSAVKARSRIVSNNAHLDARAGHVPGTTIEPEAILCMPLVARGARLGALSVYRRGARRRFTNEEVELTQQFADVAALAIHNVRTVEELDRLARTDELTGLPNRRHFQHELRRHLKLARRHDAQLSLLILDLDNFKEINDTYGHDAGDRVLRHVGRTLATRLRTTDIPARTGGDEFSIILPHTDVASAHQVADELTASLNRIVDPRPLMVSVGISSYTGDRDALLREADQHLYARKRRASRSAASRAFGAAAAPAVGQRGR